MPYLGGVESPKDDEKEKEQTPLEKLKNACLGAATGYVGYLLPFALLSRVRGRGAPMSSTYKAAKAFSLFCGSYQLLRALLAHRAALARRKETEKESRMARGVAGSLAALLASAVDPSFASPLFAFWFACKGIREHMPKAHSSLVPVSVLMAASWWVIPTVSIDYDVQSTGEY